VLVDNQPISSCNYLTCEANGKKLLTIEGLAQGDRLDPLQEAFLRNVGAQCVFCTPGQIMVAKALLLHNPAPTRKEIAEWLSGNICRCGAYPAIVISVQEAAIEVGCSQVGSLTHPPRRMILIDNDTAKRVLGMADCIAALEDAYAEEVKGTAATRTKSQMHLPTSYSERWYRLVRRNAVSPTPAWWQFASSPMSSVGRRGSARCGLTTTAWKPDRFCGLVILFKADNGEPLAILNDGVIQHLRVGATAGMMLDEDVRMGLVDRS